MKLCSHVPEHFTQEQREVWSNLEKHWECLIAANIDEFLKFIHPQFIGYGHESPLPVDRPWLEKWIGFWAKNTKVANCELRPIDIRVHGSDLAVVQYFIFTIEMNQASNKVKHVIRRYTMTWKKQADRWVVIASHNNLASDANKES